MLALCAVLHSDTGAQVPVGSIMWLRSDSGVVANNGSVSRWKDMSGNSNDATQTAPAAEPTVIAASIDDPIAVPNPFTSRTELRISLHDATQIQVVLYDELGKEVRREMLSTHAGVNLIPIERQDLPSGHYECKIMIKGIVRMIPLVIQ